MCACVSLCFNALRQNAFLNSSRASLFRGCLLCMQLLRHGSIITTAARAKELSRVIDSKIILAKRGGLHNYRQALGFFYDKKLTRDFFREVISQQLAAMTRTD